jgi:peptide/nickel transport system substrate-binding protein
MIMANLPGVPYVHTKPALGFKKSVLGYIASPIELEPFAPVSK